MGKEKQIAIEVDNLFNGTNNVLTLISNEHNYPKEKLIEYFISKFHEE